ncbi:MAG TPA: hypothetical protein VFX25_04220 [Streptosporangiaceae bacterium]|nr:hypothetical protein [Streptosporangiaceae bacterium]
MADHDRGGEVTIPGADGGQGRPVLPARAANAGPAAEDDVTEWLGDVGSQAPGTAPAGDPATGSGTSPASSGPWWPGARVTACTVVAGLVIGVLAAMAFRHYAHPSAGGGAATRQTAVRDEAARWVAQQVGRDATVSCDREMCAALAASGFPGSRLMTLGPTSDPPSGSDVVVETAAVRALFGSSLDAAWAPAVLASFGSAADRVAIRMIAPHGAAVYQVLLKADLAARKKAGAALLHDPRVTASSAAAGQLTGGLVDSRLLAALAALARHQPISIVGFGTGGPGASPGIPLRVADLAEDDRAARRSGTAYVRSARAYLSTISAAFHLTPVTTAVPPHGPSALRVQVTAPSPLG